MWLHCCRLSLDAISLSLLRQVLMVVVDKVTMRSEVRGPAGAALLTWRRFRWQATEPFVWLDDLGRRIALTDQSPVAVQTMFMAGEQPEGWRGDSEWPMMETTPWPSQSTSAAS